MSADQVRLVRRLAVQRAADGRREHTITQVAKMLGVSRPRLYRALAEAAAGETSGGGAETRSPWPGRLTDGTATVLCTYCLMRRADRYSRRTRRNGGGPPARHHARRDPVSGVRDKRQGEDSPIKVGTAAAKPDRCWPTRMAMVTSGGCIRPHCCTLLLYGPLGGALQVTFRLVGDTGIEPVTSSV